MKKKSKVQKNKMMAPSSVKTPEIREASDIWKRVAARSKSSASIRA